MCYILLIHFPVSKNLSDPFCFGSCSQEHFHTSLSVAIGFISLVRLPKSGVAESYNKLMFNFYKKRLDCFSKVALPFYIPTSYIWGFQFLLIFANTYYYIFFIIFILVGTFIIFVIRKKNSHFHEYMKIVSVFYDLNKVKGGTKKKQILEGSTPKL